MSAGTLKNRLAHVRWWADKVGKAGVIPADNAQLGIPERRFVASENKACELGDRLDKVNDPYVCMSLLLQKAFGLRCEESIKFRPGYADRGDCLVLKRTWTQGGRERTIPIITAEQRDVLDRSHRLAGAGSLIPAYKTSIQQRHVYDGQCKAAGLSNMHGLRHHYAQARYQALTGWSAPVAGGKSSRMLTPTERAQDASPARP